MTYSKLTAQTKNVGGIPVARLLPQGKRRTIGAWCFLDHAGPAQFSPPSHGLQVGAHPHTNLQTFTWMLEGEVWHQDSLGYRQLIRPKQVNLMTAGTGKQHGIAHTEQTPVGTNQLHAIQLWIALPTNQSIPPSFEHYPQLPEWSDNGVHYILTTGNFAGRTAPTTQYSPLVGVDIQASQSQTLCFPIQSNWEYGILVISGSITASDGTLVQPNELWFIPQQQHNITFEIAAGSHIMLLGGEPLPHPTLIWWNFAADNREDLCQAVSDWNQGNTRFGAEIDLDGTPLQRLRAPDVPTRLR